MNKPIYFGRKSGLDSILLSDKTLQSGHVDKEVAIKMLDYMLDEKYEEVVKLQDYELERQSSHNHFENNLNSCFVETGTFHGHGVMAALKRGCTDIHTIEIQRDLFERNYKLFQSGMGLINYGNFEIETYFRKDFFSIAFDESIRINMYCGDSCLLLPLVLKRVDIKSTFWLDGHYSAGPTGFSEQYGEYPIYKELEAIKSHHIKDHTIMIDDIMDFTDLYGGDLDNLKSAVYAINEDYTITVEQKSCKKKKFLLAKVG